MTSDIAMWVILAESGDPGPPAHRLGHLDPGLRACEGIGCIAAVRPSRCALQALLRMRYIFDGIKKIPHPEEAAERPSRRTHRVCPAQFQRVEGRDPRMNWAP